MCWTIVCCVLPLSCFRLDGPDALSRFSSGLSAADHTTVVLDKSASWRGQHSGSLGGPNRGGNNRRGSRGGGDGGTQAGGGGSGAGGASIYANFAPLEQLVDAALTDSASGSGPTAAAAGAGGGGRGGGQLGSASSATLAGGVAVGGVRGSVVGGPLSRAASSHTSHKVALGYMFQPEYIHNTTLARWVAAP